MLYEIASYPKSGNTWLRFIVAACFNINAERGIPDFHQFKDKTMSMIEWTRIKQQYIGFYKSHIINCSSIKPDWIIMIYRHPLDVFLSSLNYAYIRKRSAVFFDNRPKSVDEIVNLELMEQYFERFLEDAGRSFYSSLLGEDADYFSYTSRAFETSNLSSIRYEELFDYPVRTINHCFKTAIGSEELVDKNTDLFRVVDSKTKASGKPFYWKSVKANYKYYLSERQIRRFYDVHGKKLERLGY